MSNSNKITVDELSSKVMEYLQEYKEDLQDDVKELSDKYTKEAKSELKQISPKAKKRVFLRKWHISDESDWVEPRKLCKILGVKKWQKIKRNIF